ncbi:hypothetical protein KI387_004897 [Taxus chinensis]|uniref:Phytocyanin domain-containing protein n=1 Tax=Taxus chinensis TaxID=29808 RepID=A0AA38GM44_TAXCH|nr:hypothetical protein KI387_004897 [Taxus chinensis]
MAPKCLVLLTVIACALSITMVNAAHNTKTITVGDDNGWTLGFDYAKWAATQEFHVGDTLVFNYGAGAHNVIMVNGTAFADCVNQPNLALFSSGEDRVVLKALGNMWFICGVGAHCENGMKLKITVTQDSSYWSSAPSPASAPETYSFRSNPW